MITKKLSSTFQIANLLATLLVIAIHYNTKRFIDITDTLSLNYLIQEFITNGIARLAVPFFAFSAGVFFFLKFRSILDYKISLKKRFRSIILPYIICSLIIFSTEYLYITLYRGDFFPLSPQNLLNGILLHPLAIQFWFLRDLIVLIFIAPFIWFLAKQLSFFFFIPLLILWTLDIEFMPLLAQRHLISIETLTFFSLGYLASTQLNILEKTLNTKTKNIIVFVSAVYVLLIVYRIYIDPFFLDGDINQYNIESLLLQKTQIMIGLFLLLTISYRYFTASKLLIYLSSYTFFVYLFHTLSINRFIVKFTDFFITDAYKFYITFPLAVIIVFVLAILIHKQYPKVYAIITGGRDYKKILTRQPS